MLNNKTNYLNFMSYLQLQFYHGSCIQKVRTMLYLYQIFGIRKAPFFCNQQLAILALVVLVAGSRSSRSVSC